MSKLLDCYFGKQRFVERSTEMVAYGSLLLPIITKILKMCTVFTTFSRNQEQLKVL